MMNKILKVCIFNLYIIELECFSTYLKKIHYLRLEDIFRLKQSFSIHFV